MSSHMAVLRSPIYVRTGFWYIFDITLGVLVDRGPNNTFIHIVQHIRIIYL